MPDHLADLRASLQHLFDGDDHAIATLTTARDTGAGLGVAMAPDATDAMLVFRVERDGDRDLVVVRLYGVAAGGPGLPDGGGARAVAPLDWDDPIGSMLAAAAALPAAFADYSLAVAEAYLKVRHLAGPTAGPPSLTVVPT